MKLAELCVVLSLIASFVKCPAAEMKRPVQNLNGDVPAESPVQIVQYSYNVAGIFRDTDGEEKEDIERMNGFREKVVNDITNEGPKDAWMYIISYQEVWNASKVIKEQAKKVIEWGPETLTKRALDSTITVMEEVVKRSSDTTRKVSCKGGRHESLMTVACRVKNSDNDSEKEWLVEAFRYGWTERGASTDISFFGFKGVLGVSIGIAGNKFLLVVNVHLSSKNLVDRWKGIRIVRDLVQPYLESTGLQNKKDFSVLIVGDFNARSFSLVSPSIKNDDLSKFENNVGAGFLLLCLTDSLSGDNFYREMSAKEFCAEVLENAKKYDEITFFFKKEFPAAIEPDEVKSKTFMPTFCFNFEHKEFIKPYLGPKAGESIPSYTDRIFYVDSKDFTLNWQKYSDIPGPEGKIEFSDHRPIIGVMEIELSELAQTAFFTPKKIDQSKDLPSEKSEANFTYRNINYDLKSLVSSQKNDADSAYLYNTYQSIIIHP